MDSIWIPCGMWGQGKDLPSKGRRGAVKMCMHRDVAAGVGGDACAWCSTMSSLCLAQMGSDRGTRRWRVGWGWWW
jgi:hypothetical protein